MSPRPVMVLSMLAIACAPPATEAGSPSQTPQQLPPDVEYLSAPGQESLNLPFSEAVRVGHMLYLSGQIGNVPGTLQLAAGGIEGETRQTLENIRTTLERHGSSMDRVVKCTAMLDDMAEWPAMNEVYAEFFPGPKPARSALGADGLALGAKVEIECWATVG